AAGDPEMHEVAKRASDHRFDIDDMVLAVLGHDGRDLPVGLDHHAGKAAFSHPAPGRHQLEKRVGAERESRVGGKRPCAGAHPFVGVSDRLHRVVGDDAFQSLVSRQHSPLRYAAPDSALPGKDTALPAFYAGHNDFTVQGGLSIMVGKNEKPETGSGAKAAAGKSSRRKTGAKSSS